MIPQESMKDLMMLYANQIGEALDGDVVLLITRPDGYMGIACSITQPDDESDPGICWSSAMSSAMGENIGLTVDYLDLLAPDDKPFEKIRILNIVNKSMVDVNEAIEDQKKMLKETIPVTEVEGDSDSKAPHTLRVTPSGRKDH